MTNKVCTKCGESKPLSDFSKCSRNRSGVQSHCKLCESMAGAAYRAAHADKVRTRQTKYRTDHPEKVRASSAKYRAENPEKYLASKEKWNTENKDYYARYYVNNRETFRIHCHNRRARERATGGKLSKDIATKLFKLQRGKCACGCGQPLGDDYHRDHIMPVALGGANEDWNIQLLRQRCNNQKHAKHPVDFMQQRGFLL